MREEERRSGGIDNPFVFVNHGPFSLLQARFAGQEFPGEFGDDALSARAGVFNIQDIRKAREREIGDMGDSWVRGGGDEKNRKVRAINCARRVYKIDSLVTIDKPIFVDR